jgi:uncharacterized membrane protein YtjA (UPF0391 family)
MIQAKPVPKNLKMISLILAVLGFGTFIAGAAMGQDRAWQAFHVNWLYFTIPSSAAVMFTAVQRRAGPDRSFASSKGSWPGCR